MAFFESIISFFQLITTVIVNLFNSLLYALTIIPQIVQVPMTYVAVVPGVIGSSIICIIVIGVMRFLVGR